MKKQFDVVVKDSSLPRSNEAAVWHFDSLIVWILLITCTLSKTQKVITQCISFISKFLLCEFSCKWRYVSLLYPSSSYILLSMLHLSILPSIPIFSLYPFTCFKYRINHGKVLFWGHQMILPPVTYKLNHLPPKFQNSLRV